VWRLRPRVFARLLATPADGKRSAIDVFPAYDEQPGSCADDYIIDPDYPAVEAYF